MEQQALNRAQLLVNNIIYFDSYIIYFDSQNNPIMYTNPQTAFLNTGNKVNRIHTLFCARAVSFKQSANVVYTIIYSCNYQTIYTNK